MPLKRASLSVLIGDAHRLLGDALAESLSLREGLVVADARPTSMQELMDATRHSAPDIVLLDLWMPGVEPAAATRMILATAPDCKVIVLSWLYGPGQIEDALNAGATGFLTKSVTVNEVAEAIRRAQSGDRPVFAEELDDLMRRTSQREFESDRAWERLASLTGREIEILGLLDEGLLVEEIAEQLSISTSTVRSHVHHVLEKTGAKTQAQALTMARRHGLIKG